MGEVIPNMAKAHWRDFATALAVPRPGFHKKDKVENYWDDQVCNGAISLKQAQLELATDRLAVYQRLPAK